MQVFSVGPDSGYDPAYDGDGDFKWIVEWYEQGSYEGDGEAVGLSSDNVLYWKSLSHCSCYGPFDGGMKDGKVITLEELLSDKDDIMVHDVRKEIKDKVRDLTQQAG